MKKRSAKEKAQSIRLARKGQNAWRTPRRLRADAEACRQRDAALLVQRRGLGARVPIGPWLWS